MGFCIGDYMILHDMEFKWENHCYFTGIEETVAIIAAIAAVAGTAVSASAAAQAGEQQKKSADYQSKVLAQRALEAQQEAGLAAAAQDTQATRIISSIRASAAASGVDVASGSPLVVKDTSSEQAQLNEMYTRYAGNLQASGFAAQSALTEWGGKNARTAGYITAGGDVVNGIGGLGRLALDNPKTFHLN